jgi:hypothetical protein
VFGFGEVERTVDEVVVVYSSEGIMQTQYSFQFSGFPGQNLTQASPDL